MIKLKVNRKDCSVDVTPDTPLLWVVRESLGLTGTKFGCGMALCGACTVHLNGEAVRSCVTPVSRAAGKEVTTMIMAAAVLLRENPNPTDDDIDDGMAGNICRCGTYPRIRRAIHLAARLKAEGGGK
jgi:isoquinoline 1-oxidoreductase alpha subunit